MGIQWGTIRNEKQDSTDADILALDSRIEKEYREKLKKVSEQQAEERRDKGGPPSREIFEYAHFICRRSNTVIDRRDEGRIIEHRSECPFCQSSFERTKAQKEAKYKGYSSIRYILHTILMMKEEIEKANQVIESEKRNIEVLQSKKAKLRERLSEFLDENEINEKTSKIDFELRGAEHEV